MEYPPSPIFIDGRMTNRCICLNGTCFGCRGKTMVHWQASRESPQEILWQLCCLNDRFALDGLSPPSYGGVLWCFGWQDKPASGQKVSEKWASRYRTGADGFLKAKEALYVRDRAGGSVVNFVRNPSLTTGKRILQRSTSESPEARKKPREDNNSRSILSFFSPASKSAKQCQNLPSNFF